LLICSVYTLQREDASADSGPEPPKRYSKFKPESVAQSDSESEGSEESEADSSSDSEYEAYRPRSKSASNEWKLCKPIKRYAKAHYRYYLPEDAIRETLEENPRPNHRFLKVERIDPSVEAGLRKRFKNQKYRADRALKSDETLRRAQEKVLRLAGPLLKLYTKLRKVRKGKRLNKLNLKKVLRMVEQSVVLAGQANVGVRYARRLALTTEFVGSRKKAAELLNEYEKDLEGTEHLFRDEFQKHLHKDHHKADIGLMALTPEPRGPAGRQSREPDRGSRHGDRPRQSDRQGKPFPRGSGY
jgi:hypothetical protein